MAVAGAVCMEGGGSWLRTFGRPAGRVRPLLPVRGRAHKAVLLQCMQGDLALLPGCLMSVATTSRQ